MALFLAWKATDILAGQAARGTCRSKPLQRCATATTERQQTSGDASASTSGARLPAPYKQPYLIFNPVAGQEEPEEMLAKIKEGLADLDLKVLETKPDVSAEELTAKAVKEGADLVIASGGDGTVGAVAGKLLNTGVPMGIIPRGTANAFSVALGIPTHIDSPINFVQYACEVIMQGHTTTVDTAHVTTTEVTDYVMILLAGIGFEAEVCANADREAKDKLGPLAYIKAGLDQLSGATGFEATITIDGKEAMQDRLGAVTIANAAPSFSVLAHGEDGQCTPDDGLLDIVAYLHSDSTMQNVMDMARQVRHALLGTREKDDRVRSGHVKEVKIECDPPQRVVLDGELLGTTPLTAKVIPASLVVCTPEEKEGGFMDNLKHLVSGDSVDETASEVVDEIRKELHK
jgi:YegS/Rv2252/BmrU family lipid kinase